LPELVWGTGVSLDFHEELPAEPVDRQKLLYVRSAYRNEPDFAISVLQRMGQILDAPKVAKLIDNDVSVSDNYQRLVSATLEGVYSTHFDDLKVPELREVFIGEVRSAMRDVF